MPQIKQTRHDVGSLENRRHRRFSPHERSGPEDSDDDFALPQRACIAALPVTAWTAGRGGRRPNNASHVEYETVAAAKDGETE